MSRFHLSVLFSLLFVGCESESAKDDYCLSNDDCATGEMCGDLMPYEDLPDGADLSDKYHCEPSEWCVDNNCKCDGDYSPCIEGFICVDDEEYYADVCKPLDWCETNFCACILLNEECPDGFFCGDDGQCLNNSICENDACPCIVDSDCPDTMICDITSGNISGRCE